MKRKLFVMLAGTMFLGSAFTVSAQEGKSKVLKIVDDGFSYSFKTPANWVVDPVAVNDERLKVAYIPASKTWATSDVKIFSNIVKLDAAKKETIENVMDFDAANYKRSNGEVYIAEGDPVAIGTGSLYARVVKVIGSKQGWQAIAYVNEDKAIPFVILSCATKAEFESNYDLFEKLVASYHTDYRFSAK